MSALWWAILLVAALVGVAALAPGVAPHGGGAGGRRSGASPGRRDASAGRTHFHVVRTERGELVRSRAEARIANALQRMGIEYQYEAEIHGFRPDFYLPRRKIVIEYWGLDAPDDVQRRVKTAVYLRKGYRLLSLEREHYPSLEDELARQLRALDPRLPEPAMGA